MGTSVMTAYIWAVIVLVALFFTAIVQANMVPYHPKGTDISKRKAGFWICCILAPVIGFVINWIVAQGISIPSTRDKYVLHAGIAAGCTLIVFIILGFCLSKAFARKKIGTWF